MKKLSLFLFSISLCFILTACGGPNITQSQNSIESTSSKIDTRSYIVVEGDSHYDIHVDGNDVDPLELGQQSVTYKVIDTQNGKEYPKTFRYDVVDTTAPLLELKTDSTVVLVGAEIDPTEFIRTASDECDSSVDKDTVTFENKVDTSNAGFYTITYAVKDGSGNETTAVLSVEVVLANMSLNEPSNFGNEVEITVTFADFKDKIKPSKPSYFYSYYESKKSDGKMYYDVIFNAKNLLTESVEMDGLIDASLRYDNKYVYSGFMVTETGGDLEPYDWYSDVDPLTSGKFHYIFELPLEAQSDSKSIVITFTVDGYQNALRAR